MKKPNKREVVFWGVILRIFWLFFLGLGIATCVILSLHWAWSIAIAFGGVLAAYIVAAVGYGIAILFDKFEEWAEDDRR